MENKLSIEWNKLAHQAWKLKAKRKELEQQEKELFNELKKQIDTVEKHISRDFVFSPIQRKGNIIYSRVPEIQEMDLEQYRGDVVVVWKLEKK